MLRVQVELHIVTTRQTNLYNFPLWMDLWVKRVVLHQAGPSLSLEVSNFHHVFHEEYGGIIPVIPIVPHRGSKKNQVITFLEVESKATCRSQRTIRFPHTVWHLPAKHIWYHPTRTRITVSRSGAACDILGLQVHISARWWYLAAGWRFSLQTHW